jgi:phenylpropionate dioxygenase-like ring-hydroxylating dioxygenase large terminal subunit
MRHERQVELLRRLVDAPRPGPLGPTSMHNPAMAYTSAARFADEVRVLFRAQPVLVALSCELRDPGSFATLTVGDVPLAVVRQPDGTARGFVNVCRHRGSTLLSAPCGDGLRAIRCPYHAWTYGLDGALRAFPGAEPGFDDVDKATHGLIEVPVAERFGLLFAIGDPAADAFDVTSALHGAELELADFDIGAYTHIESREHEWSMNWKLALDTFTEPYHIPWLHKDSIGPYYLFDRWIHDAFGPVQRFIGCRRSMLDELDKPDEADWELLPHATMQYLLVPNAVLVHQVDHLELWRITPLAPDRTLLRTSVYAPPDAPRPAPYYVKNLEVLLGVTDNEDFPMQERVQRNLASGAMPELVYGKMEPALVGLHTTINERLAAAHYAHRPGGEQDRTDRDGPADGWVERAGDARDAAPIPPR